jgi:lipid-A-disaccharide synthase
VLANHLVELLNSGPERQKQIEHLQKLDDVMRLPDGHSQRGAAADVVLAAMKTES